MTLAALALASSPAHAKLFELYVQAGAGGGSGTGLSGDAKEADFFEGAAGMAYGGLLGVEIVFLDVWIAHDQFLGDDGVQGTWTRFMLGGDIDLELGTDTDVYLEIGGGVGFGVGTGQQVEPPLDNGQVTDKGFMAEARGGIDWRFSDLASLGLTVPVTWGYLVKNGPGVSVNDEANRYQSLSVTPMLYLRITLAPFASQDEDAPAPPPAQP
jgi:hypothetical protein